jgi:transposase
MMAGVSRVVIAESAAELQQLMHQQSRVWSKERLQLLYLLQSGQAASVTHAAELLGRGRITLQRWLRKYEMGGLVGLLTKDSPPGRTCQIPAAAQAALVEKLATPNSFGGYGAIQDWLKTEYQHEISYTGIHKHVRYGLQTDPKRPHPVNLSQDPAQGASSKIA